MGQLIDADKAIAMLQQEAKEWAAFAQSSEVVTEHGRSCATGISMGYKAASKDVEKMANKQVEKKPLDNS